MQKEFKNRSYGKSELASLYLPDVCPKSAWNSFKYVWARCNPRLRSLLEKVGSRRRFTPQEVKMIVQELGEP